MNLGIRARLILAALAMIAVVVVVADLYLTPALDRLLTDRIREDLLIRADLISRDAASSALSPEDLPGWDAMADELARRARARVTLIRADGAVLGDSELSPEEVARQENHASRAEVAEAIRNQPAWSIRFSPTLKRRMLYVAAPISREERIVGVARLALPLTEVDRATRRLATILLGGSALAFVVAFFLSGVVAQISSRSMRALTLAAQRMADGDLSTRTGMTGRDEVSSLGRVLDQLAASLSRTLAELRSERDLLEGILSGMREGVLVLDASRRVLLINPALREMLFLPRDLEGRSLLEVIRHAELKEILDHAFDHAGGPFLSSEIEVRGLKPRRLLVHAVPLTGDPMGLLAVFVDVTDVRRLESLRREFVANVSHELRTPVTAIRSGIETLHSAMDDREARERFLQIIDRNAERLHRLVEDLLDLSRIESRELRLRIEEIDLTKFLPQVIPLLRDRAEAKKIDLSTELPEGGCAVLADRRALEQVLGNLIENAVKYCPEGARVRVLAAAGGPMVEVSVEDTGPGIEPQHLSRLFERFYRVDAGRSRELGGTGLGLSIVKHLVEAMGGAVGVRSSVGIGSVFTFTLPGAVSPPAERQS